MDESNLSDLDYVQSGVPTTEECTKLDGTKAKIAICEVRDAIVPVFNDAGQPIEGKEKQIKQIYLEVEPFGQEIIGRDVKVSARYNLKDQDGKWVVSMHEKANTAKFLAKYNLESFNDAVGTPVIITKKTNPQTKRSWLAISI